MPNRELKANEQMEVKSFGSTRNLSMPEPAPMTNEDPLPSMPMMSPRRLKSVKPLIYFGLMTVGDFIVLHRAMA